MFNKGASAGFEESDWARKEISSLRTQGRKAEADKLTLDLAEATCGSAFFWEVSRDPVQEGRHFIGFEKQAIFVSLPLLGGSNQYDEGGRLQKGAIVRFWDFDKNIWCSEIIL
jgi:hypothetical protein